MNPTLTPRVGLLRKVFMTITKKYANIKEVSEYTGISIKTLYDWASRGILPSIKAGKKVLFDLADVDSALTHMKRNIQSPSEAVEERATAVLTAAENVQPADHGEVAPLSFNTEAYNVDQQHDQRNLSDEKGGTNV